MHRSKITRIALIGYGCVGQGIHKLLQSENTPFEITQIVVKSKKKKRNAQKDLIRYNLNEVFNKNETDLIIEVIDDSVKALEICEKAIKTGIPFISANKKMIAENLNLINSWRKEYGTPVFYEAAVCAEIPVLSELNRWTRNNTVVNIKGVLNGTTNYILSQMKSEKLSYKQALKKAQQKGFAESNPSSDVNGLDSLYKATILASFISSTLLHPNDGLTWGIGEISKEDILFARSRKQKLKLQATILSRDGGVEFFILPTLVNSESCAWEVENEWNVVEINTKNEQKILIGKGAGAEPTARAILQNLYNIDSKKQSYPILLNKLKTTSMDLSLDVIVRAPISASELLRNRIEISFEETTYEQISIHGKLKLSRLKQFKKPWQEAGIKVFLDEENNNSSSCNHENEHNKNVGEEHFVTSGL